MKIMEPSVSLQELELGTLGGATVCDSENMEPKTNDSRRSYLKKKSLAVDEKNKPIVESLPDSLYTMVIWQSIYSAGHDYKKFIRHIGFYALPVLVVGAIQGILLSELILAFGATSLSSTPFCHSKRSIALPCAAIGLFLGNLMTSLQDIILDIKLTFNVKYLSDPEKDFKSKNSDAERELEMVTVKDYRGKGFNKGFVVAVFFLVYEIIVWVAVCVVGIIYILTQDGVSDIVQAAVAMNFINDIDNFFYKILVEDPDLYEAQMNHFETKIAGLLGFSDKEDTASIDTEKASHEYSIQSAEKRAKRVHRVRTAKLFCGIPVLICITCAIVFGLKKTYC